ncbi:MAG: acyl-phosphate glycerol 3-phosphate acyltransferase [Gammaproteobacteria bacterium]|nr:MAG: acyl-phosphate glycerol 3-phosphate acyltransferase [Gammaproteobacteria bacterium]RLA24397.1 MAG: acyl-phosphate glycerol 3-phosphate acyltransferase [Gammaproteobacteria bacterium]
MIDWIWVIAAYLLGSVSAAIVVCRLIGVHDPREGGSGNPGATNVLRLAGKKAAAFTLAGDCLKGWLPVFAVSYYSSDSLLLAAVGLAAFLGHLYPLFFGFKGGKGVATALGVFAGFGWPVALSVVASWFVVAKLFKLSSLAALISGALAPLYVWLFTADQNFLVVSIVIALLLIWRHRGNIQRLRAGTESRIGR